LIVTTAAGGAVFASVIKENTAHLGGGYGHEVAAAFERGALID
jgi:hypothetical protein